MKKIYLFLIVLLLSTFCAVAQQNNPACDFHIRTEVTPASCYNNGQVLVIPIDKDGNELTIASAEEFDENNPGNGLHNIKFGYKNLYSNVDTMEQWQYEPLLVLDTGTYVIRAEVICFDPTQSGDNRHVILFDHDTINITTTYVKPKVSLIAANATSAVGYGTVPTLVCGNTGRVQLRIYDGKFPYMIRLADANMNPYDTIYFESNQYDGTNIYRYDYKEYYSIDSLGAGKHYFFVEDGCDYHLPMIWQTINSVQPPKITNVEWYAWSGSYIDTNVIRARITLSLPNANYNDPEWVQYRFIHQDINGITDTTAWKYLNMQNLSSGTNYITVTDTLWNARGYCDIYGKTVTFQARKTACGDEINLTRSHIWNYPTEFYTHQVWVNDSTIPYPAVYDSCGYYSSSSTSYGHYEPVIRFYNSREAYYYDRTYNDYTSYLTGNNYQVTYPIYWVYTDADGDTLKIDTVRRAMLPYNNPTDSWSASSGASGYPASRLRAEDIYPKYGDFSDTTIGIWVRRSMYNAQGCLIYTRYDSLTFRKTVSRTSSGRYNQYWNTNYNYSYNDYCCLNERYVYVYGNNINNIYMDSAKIELYESPFDNKYNFTAVYDLQTNSWSVEKDSLSNLARIVTSGSSSIYLYDYCLPSGVYKFKVTTKCGVYYQTVTAVFPHTQTWTLDEPSFTTTAECTNLWVKPKPTFYHRRMQNNYYSYRHSNGSTYYDVYDTTISYRAQFRIIKNLTGSPTTFETRYFYAGDSVRVTGAGTYVIEVTTGDSYSYNSCKPPVLYDTVTFEGGTIAFEYAYSWVCDENADTGFVRVKAFEGTPPYQYVLYSGPDKTGTILGENDNGIFDRVPVKAGQVVSVYAEDACMSSYRINATVFDMERVKKAWFLDGLQINDACEGATVKLFAIGLDETVTYHWTGPDGFEAGERDTEIYLPRGADTGYYKVEIRNTGCSKVVATDSVKLNVIPSPKVTILKDTTVCPGVEVQVNYITKGEGDVRYTIAYDENSKITEASHVNDDSSTFVAMAPRIYWVKDVEDSRCRYTTPEDTVVINITNHLATACDVITNSDPICRTEDGVAYASSSIQTPYYLNWYRDYEQTELLRIDTMYSSGVQSAYNFTGLLKDTAVYVTAYNADYCETKYGSVIGWINMSQGTTNLLCAQSMRFYDDGGPDRNYSPFMDVRRVFVSDDDQPITIAFDALNLQSTYDHIYIFDGNTTNEDAIIAHFTGNYTNNLPAPVVAPSGIMTVWFLSNGQTEAAGWVATVSNNPRPAAASVHVFDTIVAKIADATAHVRYDGNIEAKASVTGGRGELYRYEWQKSIDDGNTWETVEIQTIDKDTSLVVIEHNTVNTKLRVIITDASNEPCQGIDTAEVSFPVSHIKLALEVSVPDIPQCDEEYPVTVTIRNYGLGTADSVYAKVRLPNNFDFVNETDSLLFLGSMPGGMVIDTVLKVRSHVIQNFPSSHPVKGQIWYCVQGDSVPTVTYGDWDWNGAPRQIDEDVDTMHVKPFFSMDDYHIVGYNDTVCYLETAVLHASSDFSGTQYIRWYGDKALRNLLKIDTITEPGRLSEYVIENLNTVTTLYVMIESEDLCPAVMAGAVNAKLKASETHTQFMKNGTTMVRISDKVKFYDSGGATGNYSNNEDYTHTFTTGVGEIVLRLNSISLGSGEVLTIYDGPTATGVPMRQITSSIGSSTLYTSSTGSLTLRWHSNSSGVGAGWNADVVNTANYAVSEATAYLHKPLDPNKITANDALVCYGDSATLVATTEIAAPRHYTWFDSEFNMLKHDTTATGSSELTVYNQTRQNDYYVSVGNDDNCPATVPFHHFTTTSVIKMDAAANNKTTNISSGQRVSFYDEGGARNNYSTPGASWYHTFKVDTGNVVMSFSQFYTESRTSDYLQFFDGESSESPIIMVDGFDKMGGDLSDKMPLMVTSTGKSLTVYWRTDANNVRSGWRALVSNDDDLNYTKIVKDYDIFLDTTMHNKTTIISPEDIYGFYDDGGTTGAYSNVVGNLIHTFTATQGVVQADLSGLSLQGVDHLYVYDGPTADESRLIADLTGSIGRRQFFSTDNSMTFKFFTHGNNSTSYYGWNMNITSNWSEALARSTVNLHAPTQETTITVTDANVCYNSPAELTATSDNGIYYTWFASDGKTLLQRDTALNHSSTYTIPNVRRDDYYCVVTTSEGSCPTIVPYQYSDKYFNVSSNGKTTVLDNDDYIRFYDNGGPGSNYNYEQQDITHTFTSDNSQVYARFTNHYFYTYDTLFVYDGTSVSDSLLGFFTNVNNGASIRDFASNHGSLTFRFLKKSNSYSNGWVSSITTSPIGVQTVLLNPLSNEKTTYISPIDSILFYDDGGASSSYTPLERTLTHTFNALQGKVKMKFYTSNSICTNDYFYVYDGDVNQGELLGFYTGTELNNREFVSTGSKLGIKFQTVNNSSTCSGWFASVAPVYDIPKACAEVTVEVPADKTTLLTTDDFVCYGDTAVVTARSPKDIYPQYYFWYDASLNELQRDTIYSAENSKLTLPNTIKKELYQVAVQHGGECPSILPLNKATVLATINNDTLTTMVGENDYYHFTDEGGTAGNYNTKQRDYVHTFTSANNQPLTVIFSTPQHYFGSGDTLYLYDGTEMTDENLVERFINDYGLNGPFISKSSSFTFKFAKHGTSNSYGWHAIVSEGGEYNVSTVLLNKANHNKTTVLMPNDSVRFYDEGGVSNSYFSTMDTLVHTFKAMQGEVKLKFESVNVNSYDTLYVYSGSSVNPENLIAQYRPTSLTSRTFQDTALTVRFMKRNTNTSSGWSAYATNVLVPIMDTAWVDIHRPLTDVYVTSTHDTVCYDGTASLFASSEIQFPQYYAWYDNKIEEILKIDTVYSGRSEFNPEHQITDSIYHVVVYNDTSCPYLPDVYYQIEHELKPNFNFNSSKNGKTTIVAVSDSIPFYDEGGPNSSYSTTGANWSHTFTAEDGHIVLNVDQYVVETCCDYLNIYDGDNTSAPVLFSGRNYNFTSPLSFTSSKKSLTVFWHTDGSVSYSGWKGSVFTTNPSKVHTTVSQSTVTIHKPLTSVNVQSTDDDVCYDATASLFASSDIKYPQYYAWYNSDMTELLYRDTVYSGSSEFNPTHQITDSMYRVVVHNDTTCPYLPEIYFDTMETAISHVSIKSPDIVNRPIATHDTVCYDGTASLFASSDLGYPQYYTWYDKHVSEILKIDTVNSGNSEFNPTHQIQDSLYLVTVYNDTTCPYLPDLHHTPYRTLKENFLFNSSKNGKTTTVSKFDSIPFYDEGGPNNQYFTHSASWTHTFTAEDGHIVLTFTEYNTESTSYDWIELYDGPTKTSSTRINIPFDYNNKLGGDLSSRMPLKFTSTGNSLTVYWRTDGSAVRDGWKGSITTDESVGVSLAPATVTIKDPLASAYIQATDDTVCYDGTASLLASSDIAFPQYYAWYNSDMTELLKRDTIYSGQSEFNPTHQTKDSSYRVVIYNDTNCPYLPEIHFNSIDVTISEVTIKEPTSSIIARVQHDTVCYDGTATLNASSELGYPQYYTWYNSDMTELLKRDTINSGSSQFNPTHQIYDSIYSVVVHNDTTCPFLPEIHEGTVRILTNNFLFNSSKNNRTTIVNSYDSIPFYDEGGPNNSYSTHRASWKHTFTAEDGHIVLKLDEHNTESCCDYLIVYDGPTTSSSVIFNGNNNNFSVPKTFTSSDNSLTVYWRTDGSVLGSGWKGSITTDAMTISNAYVKVVNPHYDTVRTTTCQSEALFTHGMFHDIDVSASGEFVIDSAYTSIYGCDSVHTLVLTVNPSYVDPYERTICENELPYNWDNLVSFTEAGTQEYNLQTVHGCDSVLSLTLNVNIIERVTVEADTVYVEGKDFDMIVAGHTFHVNADGVYTFTDTLPGSNGCDSITRRVLTVGVPEYIDIAVYKNWDDNHNQDGKRMNAVNVSLLDGDEVVESVTLNAANTWAHTFHRLLRLRNGVGEEINYTVSEELADDTYQMSYTVDTLENGYKFNVINKHIPETLDFEIQKIWDDDNDSHELRPEEITVNLKADGTSINTIVLGVSNGWKYQSSGLPKYKNGQIINYSLSENEIYGYKVTIDGNTTDGYTLTNTIVESITVGGPVVDKLLTGREWYNTDTFEIAMIPVPPQQPLPANVDTVEGIAYSPLFITIDSNMVGNNENMRRGSFGPIEFSLAHLDGATEKTFTYHIRELTAAESGIGRITGITYSAERYEVDITIAIQNGHLQVTDMKYYPVTMNHAGEIVQGNEIEVPVITNSYSDSVTVYHMIADKQLTVIGTDDVLEDRDFKFVLRPVGDNAAVAPMPMFCYGTGANRTDTTYNEGNAVRFLDEEVEGDGLRFDYKELRKYFTDAQLFDGIVFEYEIQEVIPTSATYNDDGTGSWTLTYTDENGVIIDELYDGVVHIRAILVNMETIDNHIVLHVSAAEDSYEKDYYVNDHGDITVLEPNDALHTLRHGTGGVPIFRNARIARTSVDVVKEWDDWDNALKTRPKEVTVTLYSDGTITDSTAVLSVENGWTYTFRNLPTLNIHGDLITYSVTETPVYHYEPEYITNDDNVLVVRNVLKSYGGDVACAIQVDRSQLSDCPEIDCNPFTDVDGQYYNVIKIAGYCWMAENLRREVDGAMKYSSTLNSDADANANTFGLLYSWQAASNNADPQNLPEGYLQGICPHGWHLPTIEEINVLRTHNLEQLAKDDGHWIGVQATNESGFSALPAGYFNSTTQRFEGMRTTTYFHAATPDSAFGLQYHCCEIPHEIRSLQNGYSVRCVKDCE